MISKKFQQYYNRLNPEQKKAVEEIEGPVMVIAGPGTGKTQILAMRIANILLKTQVNPSNILALAFTNSACYEMRKRLLEIIGPASYNVQIHTFHSFCNEIIQQFPEKFLFATKINKLSDLEQIIIIKSILDKHNFQLLKPLKSPYYYQKEILKLISVLKQEGISPEKYRKVIEDIKDVKDINDKTKNQELAKIYDLYQNTLNETGYYDYDDMILFVRDKLKSDDELLSYYQEKIQYILIDEFQDANSAQNEIAQIIGSFDISPNIFVVGDDEQSIFRFQGANLENILFFKKLYPKAKIIVLKQNYRSGQNILDASRALIKHNKKQIFNILKIKKHLIGLKSRGKGEINIGEFSSGNNENFFVAVKIKELVKQKVPPHEIAVIYREHRDGKNLAETLSRLNIPYQREIGENVLDNFEIQKLINVFKVINGFHKKEIEPIIFEVLHYGFFKILTLDLYKLTYFASKQKLDIFSILHSKTIMQKAGITKPQPLLDFANNILKISSFIQNHSFTEGFEYTINETGYLQYILNLKDSALHLNNLESLFDDLKVLNTKQKNLTLNNYLNYLKELDDNDLIIKAKPLDYDYEGVKLITAHKVKGLEFEIVFIIHLTHNKWGSNKRREMIKLPGGFLKIDKNAEDLEEEERRLFYVSLTRAKKSLFLTYALDYHEGEAEKTDYQMPSKFMAELPKKYLNIISSKFFEAQFNKRLKLRFSAKLFQPHKTLKEFLIKIIEDFSLSPTALNAYLECPKAFFFNQILRVPKAKTFDQAYGTAIHKALELFFKKFIRDYKLPEKNILTKFYLKALNEEILKPDDLARAKYRGSEILNQYYEFYKNYWQKSGPPVSAEYNFYFHHVRYGDIPITGKIDKIEMIDAIGKTVRIIDYKTSSPKSLNQVLGKTKNSDFNLLYQAFFYKLLAENDPQFTFIVKEIVLEFLSPKNKKFFQVSVPIDNKDYQNFKDSISKTYAQIKKLNFPLQPSACKKRDKICEYYSICTKQ